ncbi:hypothetical protein GGI21_006000 [Coemansia aciculifera]|nr:hypothetical protein GGI21_006000 [Coemansia aciculifera]
MDFEARGLALFNALPPSLSTDSPLQAVNALSSKHLALTDSVRVPKLLHYDRAKQFLVLEDVGVHMGFEAWCCGKGGSGSSESDIDFVCARVGEWVARLHAFGFENSEVHSYFVNKPARDLLNGLMYDMTAKAIEEHTGFEDKRELADRIMQLKTELRQKKTNGGDGECTLLFGDLWPGSILYDAGKRVINLLDFEFADVGLIYGDLGHFVAHLLPLHFMRSKSYNPNTDTKAPHSVVAFLSAYKQTMLDLCPEVYRKVVGEAVRHSTVFMGIEIARDVLTGNWCRCCETPPTPKTDDPLTCECAEILLLLARTYINNTPDSIFNILN